jgi:hypothetical protein
LQRKLAEGVLKMNNVVNIPVALRKQNKVVGEFYPLQKAELMALRKAKLINNAAYVHLALRTENPFCDRPVEVIPKEFALRWQIPEVSVYKAIAKLKELGLIKIHSGKLVINWVIKTDIEQLSIPINDEKPINTEPIADPWDDPHFSLSDRKNSNYQIGKKIIKFDNPLSDPIIDYQIRENRGLKAVSDIASIFSQTLQTDQTNQTAEDQNFCTNTELAKDETVNSDNQKSLVNDGESKVIEVEQVPRDVTQNKTKIISPSKSSALPADLEEKLRELNIPLDKRVKDAIAAHDISQAYGAAAHVENTWETINNPKSVFLFQLPQQPIEKLGSRYSEEVLSNIKAQNLAIEEERKNPEYQQKAQEFFARIREISEKRKKK